MNINCVKPMIGLSLMVPLLVVMLPTAAQAEPASDAAPPGELQLDGRGVPIGCDLIEGDIIYCGSPGDRSPYTTALWPDGIVPYDFDSNVSAVNQQRSIDAMAVWEDVTAVDFVPWVFAEHGFARIRMRDSTGDDEPTNSSFVGRQGGVQIVNIVSWTARFIIAHELGHSLGYWHEQSRPDRDDYVQIEWDRIIDGKDHNFDLHSMAGYYGPYDFESIMHYGQCAFSCCGADPDVACSPVSCSSDLDNCRTITVLPPYDTQWQNSLGNRSYLSFWDARIMSFLYPESDWYFVGDPPVGAGSGTFMDPYYSLPLAYLVFAPEGGTIWMLDPGDNPIGTDTLERPMTLRAGNGIVTLVP